jgi:hypothetical protein
MECVVNGEIIVISEIYNISVSIYFEPEDQISQPPNVIICQIVTGESGEVNSGNSEAHFPVKGKESLGISDEVGSFITTLCRIRFM